MAAQIRFRSCCCMTAITLLSALRAQAGLKPVDPAQFFVAPDREAVLSWTLDPADSQDKLPFTIADYQGRRVVEGSATIGDKGRVRATVNLKQGYYEIVFAPNDERFGICVLPERDAPADPFFCADSAWSWLELRGDMRDALARILHRMGVSCSRERMHWGEVHTAPQQWEWQTKYRYDDLRKTCTDHGLPVLEMFHNAPGWMGATGSNLFPVDLVQAADSWAKIAKRWRPHWAALEVWNEPDIDFGSKLPGDQYVPVAKAVAYGVRDIKPPVPLVGGVFTHICPDAYRRSCALNGLLDEVDVISFHTYDNAAAMQKMVQTYRDWLKASKAESMPLWITESGRPWKQGPARPPADQDADSALDITMKGIEAKACGVAGYFPFISVWFEEGVNNFGMMGKEVTPLRSMAAYAQAITALAHRPYRGDIVTTDPAIQRARVFGDAKQSVIVLYTGQVRTGATVKLDLPIVRLEGIDGRALPTANDGAIPIPDGLTYVWVDSAKLGAVLRTDTLAAKLYAVSRQPAPQRPKPSPVILQHRLDLKQMAAAPTGYTVSPGTARHFALHVRVQNLADRPERVGLNVASLPGDSTRDTGMNRKVDVAARSTADVDWELDLSKLVDAQGACTLVVSGNAESKERTSPLAIDVAIKQAGTTTRP